MASASHFIHVLGAIAVGYYLLFPVFIAQVERISATVQEGYVKGLHLFNRIAQYILILQFITGVYLIRIGKYSPLWIIIVITVFTILAAFAGLMGRLMKRIMTNVKAGREIRPLIVKVTIYSISTTLCLVILVFLMSFPTVI